MTASDHRQSLEALLKDLDVDPEVLRRDPAGMTWLPDDVRTQVEATPRSRAVFRAFVEQERALYAEADVGVDPFFTDRVLRALPTPLRFTGITPRRRAMVLGAFHALALLSAYVVFAWAAPGSMDSLAASAHHVLETGLDPSGLWMAAGLAFTLVVAIVAGRSHTTAA